MKAAIYFADTEVKEAFEALKISPHTEDQELAALLDRAGAFRTLASIGAAFSSI